MSKRRQFLGTSWEVLEDRQLLSAGNVANAMARLARRAPLFGPVTPGQGGQVGQGQGGRLRAMGGLRAPGSRLAAGPFAVNVPGTPQGTGATGFSVVQPNAPVSPLPPQLNLPAVSPAVAPPPTSPAPSTSISYSINPNAQPYGFSGGAQRGIGGSRSYSYAVVDGSRLPSASSVASSVVAPSTSPTASTGNLEATLGSPSTSTAINVGPGYGGGMGSKMMPPPNGMMPPSDASMIADPNFVPMPFDMLEGAVLNSEQVSTLKSAAADLVANHTLGVDPSKDKAAVDAFQGVLNDLALSVWSQVNVTSTDSATALKSAAATFAESYTGGTDALKDQNAWKAFNSALAAFTQSIHDPKAVDSPRPDDPMGMNDGPWLHLPTMMAGGSLKYLTSGLLDGQAITKDDLTDVQSAINTFAVAYSSGADKAKDLAAGETLLNEIGAIMSKRWERLVPPEYRDIAAAARTGLAEMAPMGGDKMATKSRVPMTVAMGNGLRSMLSKI